MIWFIRRFGFRRFFHYESERRRRERQSGVKFDPKVHGEALLRAVGADEEAINRAKERGLA